MLRFYVFYFCCLVRALQLAFAVLSLPVIEHTLN
jgi:hypothetical protein